MACRYTYQGKTYTAWEFDDLLRSLPVAEAVKYMPRVMSAAGASQKVAEAKFSPRRPTGFFSPLERAFEQAKLDTQPASQWKAWLSSNQSKMGLKADEIQWSGVTDYLDALGKERVTRGQITEFLQNNGVQVQEVRKEEGGFDKDNPELPEDGPLAIDSSGDRIAGPEYNFVIYDQDEGEAVGYGRTLERAIVDAHRNAPEYWGENGSVKYQDWQMPGGTNYREILLTLPESAPEKTWEWYDPESGESAQGFATQQEAYDDRPSSSAVVSKVESRNSKQNYTSPHWDEKNIVAHLRLNDRTDDQGNDVLFVEEVQSDWAQDARKKDVPEGPFVGKTEAWVALGIKKVILEATRNGYDKVAFVTGQQSADRYSLAKSVKSIDWRDRAPTDQKRVTIQMSDSSTPTVLAVEPNGTIYSGRFDGKMLDEVIGKELANKVLAETSGTMSGLDLQVGGEGMKSFYDKIVPQVLSNVLKKLGGKTELVQIEDEYSEDQKRRIQAAYATGSREDIAAAKAEKKPSMSQIGFTITPEMRATVERDGLPMFSPKRPVVQQAWTPALPQFGKLDKFIYEAQNKLIDLKRVRDAIKESGIRVREEYDPYLAEELYHGRAAYRVQLFFEQEMQPLLDEMKLRGITVEEMDKFLHARHAKERNKAMAEANPNQAELNKLLADAANAAHSADLDLQMAQANGTGITKAQNDLQYAQRRLESLLNTKPYSGTEEERQKLSGMSNKEARQILKDFSARDASFKKLADKVDQMTEVNRQLMLEYGLENADTVKALRDKYNHYVPLMREMDTSDLLGTGGNGKGAGYSVRGSTLKQATGSLRQVESILANLMAQREQLVVRGEKAIVGKALYGMALSAPDENFWSVIKPTDSKEQIRKSLVASGIDPKLIQNMVDAPMESYVDPVTGLVKNRLNHNLESLPNAIVVRLAGQDRVILFNEDNDRAVRLAKSLKNLDMVRGENGLLDPAAQAMGKATRYISSINTQYNPIFGLKNFLRDAQGAHFNLATTGIAGEEKKVMLGINAALRQVFAQERGWSKVLYFTGVKSLDPEWQKYWEEMRAEGGLTGYMESFNGVEDRIKAIQAKLGNTKGSKILDKTGLGYVLDLLGDYNTAIESGVRLSAYRAAREKGLSSKEAASIAKNLTVNFNRKGRTGAKMNSAYAFFNAAIQGNARITETMMGGHTGKAAAMYASKFAGAGISLGVLLTVMGIALMGDDWDDIPDFIRERDLVIPLGKMDIEGASETKGGHRYIHIPMALGYNLLPNTGRLLTEMAYFGEPGKRMLSLLGSWAGGVNPMGSVDLSSKGGLAQLIAPSFVDPLIQLDSNKNAFGRPISKEERNPLDPTPAPDRVFKGASQLGRGISWGLDRASGGDGFEPGAIQITPDQVDFIFGQLTGGVGREGLKMYQFAANQVTGDSTPLSRVPLVGMFYDETKSDQNVSAKFYEIETKIHTAWNGVAGQEDSDKASAYFDKHPAAALEKYATSITASLTKINKARKAADENGDKAEVKRLETLATELKLGLIEQYGEVTKAK